MYEPKKHEITAEAFYYYIKFIKELEVPTSKQLNNFIKKSKKEVKIE